MPSKRIVNGRPVRSDADRRPPPTGAASVVMAFAPLLAALARHPDPIFVAGPNLRPLWQNHAFERSDLARGLVVEGSGGLDPASVLGRLVADPSGAHAIVTGVEVGGEGYDAHLLFLAREADAGLPGARPQADVCVVRLERRAEAPAEPPIRIALTRVEELLVDSLAAGLTVREAAEALRISYHTARKYVQNLFLKTGARRQAELVALLSAPARSPPAGEATVPERRGRRRGVRTPRR